MTKRFKKNLKDLQNIKRCNGIYFLFDKNEIVYIGYSRNVYCRVLEHIIEDVKVFDEVTALYNEDLLTSQVMEVALISELKTKYNKLSIDFDLYWRVLPLEVKKQLGEADNLENTKRKAKAILSNVLGSENE